jgi:TatD DNase family protein
MFRYLDLGYHIGITGIVTHKKRGEYLRKLVPMIPEDRILIETDCPYLTPSPVRNRIRRNEPGFVKFVLLKLAEIRNTDPDRLSQVIFDNTRKLYGVQRFSGKESFFA